LTRHPLAINGGAPVRNSLLPYGRQQVTDDDIAEVEKVLRSDYLTTGPKVAEFEDALAKAVGVNHAVVVSSGTAALHALMAGIGIGIGDEVIVPAITFAATANAVLYCGGTPVFADVNPDTLLMDSDSVAAKVTDATRAMLAVDFAGQSADYEALRSLVIGKDIRVLADACHALGGARNRNAVGTIADASTFSFHPVKHVAAGEGGAIVTNDPGLDQSFRTFRNHGISTDHLQRASKGTWTYDMSELGFNYRLSDIHSALGLSQLKRLDENVRRRQAIASRYDDAFGPMSGIAPLQNLEGNSNAYHLYVIRLDLNMLTVDRGGVFAALRSENIGVNVHYAPVPWHSYYRNLGYEPGSWPVAERTYEEILSLPIFPAMSDKDAEDVISAVDKVLTAYRR
jgi:perosamine synthetase